MKGSLKKENLKGKLIRKAYKENLKGKLKRKKKNRKKRNRKKAIVLEKSKHQEQQIRSTDVSLFKDNCV